VLKKRRNRQTRSPVAARLLRRGKGGRRAGPAGRAVRRRHLAPHLLPGARGRLGRLAVRGD